MKLPLAGIKRRNSWTHFCSAVNPGQERIQSSGWCHSHPWPGLPVCLVAHKHAVIKGHPWRFDDDIKKEKKENHFFGLLFMQLFLSISCLAYCSCERIVSKNVLLIHFEHTGHKAFFTDSNCFFQTLIESYSAVQKMHQITHAVCYFTITSISALSALWFLNFNQHSSPYFLNNCCFRDKLKKTPHVSEDHTFCTLRIIFPRLSRRTFVLSLHENAIKNKCQYGILFRVHALVLRATSQWLLGVVSWREGWKIVSFRS